MNVKGTFDDYQRFVDELTDEVESGYTREHEDIVGYDATRAVLNILQMLQRWGLITFMDEN